MYLYMGKTFKIGLGSLGGTWGLIVRNVAILSKNKFMNIGGGVCGAPRRWASLEIFKM